MRNFGLQHEVHNISILTSFWFRIGKKKLKTSSKLSNFAAELEINRQFFNLGYSFERNTTQQVRICLQRDLSNEITPSPQNVQNFFEERFTKDCSNLKNTRCGLYFTLQKKVEFPLWHCGHVSSIPKCL